MPLNISTLKTRTLSSVYYVAVFMSSLLLGRWVFLIFCLTIHAGCWLEFQKMTRLINPQLQHNSRFSNYGIIITGSALILLFIGEDLHWATISVGEIGWWLLLVFVLIMPIVDILFSQTFYISKIMTYCVGFVYLSLSFALFARLRMMNMPLTTAYAAVPINVLITLTMVLAIWLNDTFAYLVGSLIGRTPLMPSVSPKKTIEGTIGGILLSCGVVFGAGHYFIPDIQFVVLLIAFIAAVTGSIGDLVESKLKRVAGVKDSGNILPGHGGFLDRFDSIIFATPFVYAVIELIKICQL